MFQRCFRRSTWTPWGPSLSPLASCRRGCTSPRTCNCILSESFSDSLSTAKLRLKTGSQGIKDLPMPSHIPGQLITFSLGFSENQNLWEIMSYVQNRRVLCAVPSLGHHHWMICKQRTPETWTSIVITLLVRSVAISSRSLPSFCSFSCSTQQSTILTEK